MSQQAPDNSRPIWQRRWPWVLLLLAVSAGWFGSYFRHGINFVDEGGTLTLQTKRLLDGEVPYRDIVLGYNVGWFLPIVALFKITGVSFVALRVYCFALSTLAVVLGFLTVERAARHAGLRRAAVPLGLLVAVMLLLVPGMTFKNYNPLAAVANSWCLLGFVLAKEMRPALWRALAGGLVLGATWLVRIDLGTLFALLWVGVCLGRLCARQPLVAVASLAVVAASVVVMHLPVAWDAKRRGYFENIAGEYQNQWRSYVQRVPGFAAKPPPRTAAKPAAAAPAAKWKNESLGRVSWADVQAANEKNHGKMLGLFLLTYLPLLSLAPLALWAFARWVRAVVSRGDTETPLAALVLLGGALAMFPQFFIWRPDAPHLSEFGPGFWTGAIGACALLGAWGASWKAASRWLVVLLAIHAGVWIWRMLPDRWCGTIAAKTGRRTLFDGANGVRVYETAETARWMGEFVRAVHANSGKDDWLVVYPYHPSLNIIADRRTYEKHLYTDNATQSPAWSAAAVRRIEEKRPRLVVISEWAANGTDASRFKNWAAPVHEHVVANYELVGTYDEKEEFKLYRRK